MSREIYGATLADKDWKTASRINHRLYEATFINYSNAVRRKDMGSAERLKKALFMISELGERIAHKRYTKNCKGGNE